jgi:hypothetical protein
MWWCSVFYQIAVLHLNSKDSKSQRIIFLAFFLNWYRKRNVYHPDIDGSPIMLCLCQHCNCFYQNRIQIIYKRNSFTSHSSSSCNETKVLGYIEHHCFGSQLLQIRHWPCKLLDSTASKNHCYKIIYLRMVCFSADAKLLYQLHTFETELAIRRIRCVCCSSLGWAVSESDIFEIWF